MIRQLRDARPRARTAFSFLCLMSVAAFAPPAAAATIGLVFTDLRYALVETPEKSECPDGLQKGEAAQFKAMPDYKEHLAKLGGGFESRGPIGQLPQFDPTHVDNPLPWVELKSKLGYGVNLDGTPDGHATAKTCKHEKFTSPEGEPIDNQMARVLGCVQGWRTTGFLAEFYSNEVYTSPINRHLVEITGVDNEQNDPSVEITIYKGMDRLVQTASKSYVPFMSHRIDSRFPEYTYKTHGKIVDGVLITDPIPMVRVPLLQVQIPGEQHMHDFTLRLKLDANGAEGILDGYEDIAVWYNNHSKNPASDIGAFSPSHLYRELYRHADGYPDPKTGQCTAISTAYKVKAVRALIVHPDKKPEKVATAPQPEKRIALARD